MYINAFAGLPIGRCRYGLMLTETGFVMDDGVVARLAADRFHVTTTTGGAPRVLAHMEDYLQTEFADLEVWLTSTTEHWATIAVQGPKARETIAPLLDGVDLSNAAFPHMSVRDARVLGVPARLMRVSFTGELGYEINVGSAYGLDVWKAVFAEVEKQGGCAYGTEATHVLRAEKGYVIVGQETDGTVTPADLGLDWAIGKAKADFVGRRSLLLPELAREGRKQLVGLMTEDPALVLEEGAQVTQSAAPPVGSRALGHVTSSYRSPAARPLDRACARRRRPRPHRPKGLCLDAGGPRRARNSRRALLLRPRGSAPPCLSKAARPAPYGGAASRRPARETRALPRLTGRGSMSSPWLTPRFPLDDVALPSGPRFAIADAPPADRYVMRGGDAARAACSAAFGAELPAGLGRGRTVRRAGGALARPGRVAPDRRGRLGRDARRRARGRTRRRSPRPGRRFAP